MIMLNNKEFKNNSKLGELLSEIDQYTHIYEFNFQFWGEDMNSVYVYKGGVELFDIGGRPTIIKLLEDTLYHLKKIKARTK